MTEEEERSHWRKRQILEDEQEHHHTRQRAYTRPKTRYILRCDQLGVCQMREPRCRDCLED